MLSGARVSMEEEVEKEQESGHEGSVVDIGKVHDGDVRRSVLLQLPFPVSETYGEGPVKMHQEPQIGFSYMDLTHPSFFVRPDSVTWTD